MSKIEATELGGRRTTGKGDRHITSLATELLRIAGLAGLFAIALVVLRDDPFLLNILAYTCLFGGLATSWNIIGGFGGQFSLGHGVFFAAGAYTTANLYFHFGISPWLTLIPAVVVASAVALAVSWPTFRLKGPFFAIATLALNEVAFVLANYFDGLTGGPRGMMLPFRAGFENMVFTSKLPYAIIMIGFLLVTLVTAAIVLRSRLGYYLQAVRLDEDAARSVGIGVLRVKLMGMAVSAGLTGVGGSLFAMYIRYVDPPTLLSIQDVGVRFLLISLIGGVGTLYGPLAGALLIVPLEFQLRATLGSALPGGNLMVLGALLVIFALFMRKGLVGTVSDIWDRYGRRRDE
ncbi:branched-chain amino acid transport system permease protein [Palleronia aestuarii]|uniref:Branched-chain amino acid transport system permease protein n=1 Tax=Palleronia aestuarii TaxID=568105 RepID=A0A2W7MZM8_9RHOB|nr:branched-chain amino acid ABC transporter permease [Palleronia aestuarii]PZX13033.1 branched-chain amino acid transport system permease protein [Palleronia aestuarii]